MNILEVKNLEIWNAQTGEKIIKNSSFHVKTGSCLAIVGESGSGKSVTCKALMRLNSASLPQSGDILFKGENINQLSLKEMRRKRGKNLCLILQNGMSAFDPSCVIGVHLRETLAEHFNWNKEKMELNLQQAMESVMLKNPTEIMAKYPHQLSGGMLQRIMIALAIVLEPDIIIADEPTTALDTISQFEVISQLIDLRNRINCSIVFVSHDLGVVRKIADEVLVMKDGEIVERGTTDEVFQYAKHDYTKYLISTRLALSNNFMRIMGEGV